MNTEEPTNKELKELIHSEKQQIREIENLVNQKLKIVGATDEVRKLWREQEEKQSKLNRLRAKAWNRGIRPVP